MSEIAMCLLLSGFVCPPIECSEVMYDSQLVICCVDGRPLEPATMCGDRCERVDIDEKSFVCPRPSESA